MSSDAGAVEESPFTRVALTPMRRIIAARMVEAKHTIPHYRMCADVEMDAILALRRELRARHVGAVPSLNDFLIKASANALLAIPAINIQWAEDEIRQFQNADISVVVALKDGLSTPIIRRAETKSVWEIAREIKDLATKAKSNVLKMHEILGGSFSISNLGMYGIDQFDAVINPPQCAILAAGSATPRVVVAENGGTRVATIMRLTLSIDHRAVDGPTGAAFLAVLRKQLESPEQLHGAAFHVEPA
jgi:pyruvate dehydrogenase E2 component (dihydrolipoamide acetyltransferase)